MTDMEAEAGVPDAQTGDLTYAYKPSLMGAPWEFRLQPDHLAWTIGPRCGRIAYSNIRRVRLSFRPVTMQPHRFIAEIWSSDAPRLTIASASWRGMTEQERFDRPYRDFIFALHERLAASGSRADFQAGSNPFLYWPGLAIFVMISAGITALLLRALQQDILTAVLFLAAFFALLLWQIGGFFRRNRPRRYDARHIPAEVLPTPKD